jgi:hypothetical protein
LQLALLLCPFPAAALLSPGLLPLAGLQVVSPKLSPPLLPPLLPPPNPAELAFIWGNRRGAVGQERENERAEKCGGDGVGVGGVRRELRRMREGWSGWGLILRTEVGREEFGCRVAGVPVSGRWESRLV